VTRHHSATAITEGDRPARVLAHECLVQPTSNGEPTLCSGAWCLRNGHVAFGVLLLAVDTHDVELKFHSRRLRHARVTAITEVIRAFGFVAGLLAFASAFPQPSLVGA
jgi:hypothetical protein